MDSQARDSADAALHAYVGAIAQHFGVPPEHTSCDAGTPATACIGFDRCNAVPHDLALVWDERLGWAAAVQVPGGERIPFTYLGTSAVPPLSAVTSFLTDLVADRERGQHRPPDFGPCTDLPDKLTAATRDTDRPFVPRPRMPSRQAPARSVHRRGHPG